jgi:hypothetical protein
MGPSHFYGPYKLEQIPQSLQQACDITGEDTEYKIEIGRFDFGRENPQDIVMGINSYFWQRV